MPLDPSYDTLLGILMASGFSFLQTIMTAPASKEKLELVNQQIEESVRTHFERVATEISIEERDTADTETLLKQREDVEALLKQREDIEGTEQKFENELAGPNAGWTWSNGEKHTSRWFEENKTPMRKWGYVMWDKRRLEELNILDNDPKDLMNIDVRDDEEEDGSE